MPDRVVLLTGEVEAPHLTALLRQHAPDLRIDVVEDADSLAAAFAGDGAGTRLVSLLSGVIVPADILSALYGPAYNFHPGPPEYPGSCAAGFAIYDGAETFGTTLHEMAPRVDSGPIVEVRRFPVPPSAKFQDLEIEAFKSVIEMFRDYAGHLATDDAPLPRSGEAWQGRPRTQAEADRLCRVEADLSEEEIVRRYRAFG